MLQQPKTLHSGQKTPADSEPWAKLELFPIPVFRWRWQAAETRKEAILDTIRARRMSDRGISRSNRQGWHSAKDLPAWGDAAIQELVRWCAECAERSTLLHQGSTTPLPTSIWRVGAWANVNPPGGAHNISHTHSVRNWHWSACYYVDLPDFSGDARGGELVLEDRGSGLVARDLKGPHREHRLNPREGELIIFPSWLYHRVEQHHGSGDRVTIAFNLYNPDIEKARLWSLRPRWWWRKYPKLMRQVAKVRGMPDLSVEAPDGWDVDPRRD